ncbi:glutathione S-transferase N-terminal domain-containing protein, partial [uncultured Psychrosphaera sp.]|uniref:glutathione S-transferase N-terminal domain-containing protein n=1 Tax=uncultured Psychrosphaera sp. TaxID=1403522 RepID=UPI00260B5D06
MITLHHLNNSRSQRILWLLEELGLEYEIKEYTRDHQTSAAPDSLKAIHPLGKSPVITDGDLTIAESGAIIEYLLDSYDTDKRLRPTKGQA